MNQRLDYRPTHVSNELSEFVSVDYPPQDRKPVLCVRESIGLSSKYELITAIYDPVSYPQSPWRHVNGSDIRDTGGRILGWKNAHRWLQPVN